MNRRPSVSPVFFFFNDTATTEIYTLSLHDALPILLPDPVERVLAHVLEGERRDPARRVAGPNLPRGRDGHIRPGPTAHARLGVLLMIVGQHPHDLEPRPESCALALHHAPGFVELRLGRHERSAVVERPPVELRVGELDALRTERLGEPDQRLHLMQVAAVPHDLYGEPEAPVPRVVVGRDL